MSSQINSIKSGQKRAPDRLDSPAMCSSRVAAKNADIKAFSDLMREKKRSAERSTEQHPGLSTLEQSLTTAPMSVQTTDMGSGISRGLERQIIDTPQGSSLNKPHEQTLSLSLNSDGAAGAQGNMSPKIIESVVSVVQRMIMNHAASADPGKWDIQLGIDGLQVMEMSLVHLGHDEWRLDLVDDQSSRKHDTEFAELVSIYENIEQVLPELEAALREARPALRLSVALVDRSSS